MKWRKRDDYYVESSCGKYRIVKAFVRGRPRYTSFIRKGAKFVATEHPATDTFKEQAKLLGEVG